MRLPATEIQQLDLPSIMGRVAQEKSTALRDRLFQQRVGLDLRKYANAEERERQAGEYRRDYMGGDKSMLSALATIDPGDTQPARLACGCRADGDNRHRTVWRQRRHKRRQLDLQRGAGTGQRLHRSGECIQCRGWDPFLSLRAIPSPFVGADSRQPVAVASRKQLEQLYRLGGRHATSRN